MTNQKFSELCRGTAKMLEMDSKQADGAIAASEGNGQLELRYDKRAVVGAITPLLELASAITKAAC